LRQVELDNWQLRINGRRVFVRGANWVPADILPGRVREADYHSLLALARGGNMNMLRVWGGGLREKRAFYALCDRMGILIWQEFPFACAVLSRFPRSREYLALVEREARGIVRDLRHHPSVVLWCGGNEFEPERNRPLVSTLQCAIADEDATRPFLPASPANGDSHFWNVWHGFASPTEYLDDETLFASEFGMQSPPQPERLREFIPSDQLWPPGPAWAYHGAGLDKLQRYARPFLAADRGSLDEFILASSEAQARGLQLAIEHYRRRKAQGCGGVLVWQLNEPWPAISWALVDYRRQCKPAYVRVKHLYSPQLVSVHYPLKKYDDNDRFCATIWVINDASREFPGCDVQVSLWDGEGNIAERFQSTLHVAPDAVQIAGRLSWILPTGGSWRLTCRLEHQGQVLTENDYDLTILDAGGPDIGQRFWRWMAAHVKPG
jgi:beta-mannosidase